MRTLERGERRRNGCSFPLTLHLGPAESEAFEANRELFERLGLRDRRVRRTHADRAQRADAAPALRRGALPARDARRAHRRSCTPAPHARHERLAATVACKAAIKAGDALSPRRDARAVHRARATRRCRRTTCTVARRSCSFRGTSSSDASADAERDEIARHLRADGGREERRRDVARRATRLPSSSAPTRGRSIAGSTSARPSRRRDERARVPHRGIDVVDPTERYSAAQWAEAADGWIDEARAAGRTPLVVGGTGFYLRALFERTVRGAAARRRAARGARAGARRPSSRGAAPVGRARSIRRARTSGARSCCAPSRSRCSPGRRMSELHRDTRASAALAGALSSGGSGSGAGRRGSPRGSTTMLARGWPDEVRALMHVGAGRTRRRGRRPGTARARRACAGELDARRGAGADRDRDAAVREAAAHLVPASAAGRRA